MLAGNWPGKARLWMVITVLGRCYWALFMLVGSSTACDSGTHGRATNPSYCRGAGRPPTSSPSPPRLTRGKISDATERTLSDMADPALLEAIDHVLGHEADAAVGAPEARSVELRVL